MSDILRFNADVPVEVVLRWDEGKQVEGRYGQQVMFTLADGRIVYVPPVVASRISAFSRASLSRSARRRSGRRTGGGLSGRCGG